MFSLTVWVFFVVALVAYYLSNKKKRSINLPGPWGLPIIGNVLEMDRQFYPTLTKWNKKYGPLVYVRIGPVGNVVVVGDPVIAKEMLALDAFVGRAYVNEFLLFEGEPRGIINTEGPAWEQQRRFVVRQLRDFGFGKSSLESVIMEEVNDFNQRMIARKGEPVDNVKSEMTLATVNSLWSIVAGTRFSQTDPKLKDLTQKLSGTFDEVAKKGALMAFFPSSKHIIPELSGYNIMRKMMKGLSDFVGNTVKEHKESFQDDSPRDFIDVYLNEMKKTTDPESSFFGKEAENQIIGVVTDLFQASADTISTTLNWILLHLLLQTEIQRKLQAEIKSVTGNSRSVLFSDRPKMPYTLAIINETLRWSAPPFGVPHRVLFDTEFRGVFYPKGTTIMINLFYIHNDPKLWGDPENFRPERFLSADEKTVKKIDALNPFLVGRRQCPGESLARDSIFLFLTNTLQKFNLKKDPGAPEPTLEPAVSFVVTTQPYNIVFEERKDL